MLKKTGSVWLSWMNGALRNIFDKSTGFTKRIQVLRAHEAKLWAMYYLKKCAARQSDPMNAFCVAMESNIDDLQAFSSYDSYPDFKQIVKNLRFCEEAGFEGGCDNENLKVTAWDILQHFSNTGTHKREFEEYRLKKQGKKITQEDIEEAERKDEAAGEVKATRTANTEEEVGKQEKSDTKRSGIRSGSSVSTVSTWTITIIVLTFCVAAIGSIYMIL